MKHYDELKKHHLNQRMKRRVCLAQTENDSKRQTNAVPSAEKGRKDGASLLREHIQPTQPNRKAAADKTTSPAILASVNTSR